MINLKIFNITLFVVLIVIIFYYIFKQGSKYQHKKEKYQPIEDDVVIYNLLPYLGLYDLKKYASLGLEEQIRVLKFIKKYLKFKDCAPFFCNLRSMIYVTSKFIDEIVYGYLKEYDNPKPRYPLNKLSELCLEIFASVVKFSKSCNIQVDNEDYFIFNSYLNKNFIKPDDDFLEEIMNTNQYKKFNFALEKSFNPPFFVICQVWIKDIEENREIESYFQEKFNQLKDIQKNYRLPFKIRGKKNYFYVQIGTAEPVIELDDFPQMLVKNPIEFSGGTLYDFNLFINFLPQDRSTSNYGKYLEYLSKEKEEVKWEESEDEEKEEKEIKIKKELIIPNSTDISTLLKILKENSLMEMINLISNIILDSKKNEYIREIEKIKDLIDSSKNEIMRDAYLAEASKRILRNSELFNKSFILNLSVLDAAQRNKGKFF